jgi:tetratricopeptide (TPR) repeat protein
VPDKLDETAARELAVKQGLGTVLSGAIDKQGTTYTVSMKLTQPLTGEISSDKSGKASGQDQVVATATRLVSAIRKALGDRTSESEQLLAMTSLSASSLDVVRYYAAAMESTSNSKFEDARQSLLKAVDLDPKFGIGYLALAGVSSNLRQPVEAEKYVNEALSHLDGMTERERYTTRGMYFRLTKDYKQCVTQHSELIARYAADVVGHNQLALCASQLRDLKTARDEMRAVVKLLPKRAIFRDNLALYSNYASDFETGETEARNVLVDSPTDFFAPLALAFSQMGRDQVANAAETLTALASAPGLGPTFSLSGLADLAVYSGRYADAVRLAEQGAAANLAAKQPDLAAAKYAEQAYAHLLAGRKSQAIASADRALANSQAVKIRFLAARTFIEAGAQAKATPLMAALAAEVQPEPQAYGKILEALIVMAGKDARPAIKLLTDANALLDTWIGHFDLGRAYLAAGQYPQADSEFDRCLQRRGEALALFLDEEPTYGYFPMTYYFQGRVREAMKIGGAADSYRAYLAIREKAGEDPLLADIRRRVR